jgi:hypothetical protein
MTNPVNSETELRHAVIDRLIAASMRDVTPAREAEMKSWRAIGTKPALQATVTAGGAVKQI